MKRGRIGVVSVAMALVMTMGAQEHHGGHAQPYAEMHSREIKALSADEIEQLRAGAGMGLAMAAELNQYPGPKHVLELADALGLTDEQSTATKRVFEEMRTSAVELGEKIVDAETRLDAAFADGSIDERSLSAMTSAIAELTGRLRATHLEAHLAMKRLLTPGQIAAYDRLRGYTASDHNSHHHPTTNP